MIGAVSNQSNAYTIALMRRDEAKSSSDTTDVASAATQRLHRGPPPGPPPEALDSAAELLGMSTDELTSALQSGTTLKDLAQTKGVSQSDLLAAVVDGLKTGAAERSSASGITRPEPSDDQLTEIATQLINGNRPPMPSTASLDTGSDLATLLLRSIDSATSDDSTVSSLLTSSDVRSTYKACSAPADADELSASLNVDVSDLLEQLKSGVHLSDIAEQSNTSTEDLLTSMLMGMLTDTKA